MYSITLVISAINFHSPHGSPPNNKSLVKMHIAVGRRKWPKFWYAFSVQLELQLCGLAASHALDQGLELMLAYLRSIWRMEGVSHKTFMAIVSSLMCWWFSVGKIGSMAEGVNRTLPVYKVALSGRSDVGKTSIFRRIRGDGFLDDTTKFRHLPDDTIKVRVRDKTVKVRNWRKILHNSSLRQKNSLWLI